MEYQNQQLNTCSKLTKEALEQGAKYDPNQNKDSRGMTLLWSRVDGDSKHWFLAIILQLKVNNRDSKIMCEICNGENESIKTRSMASFRCLYC